MPKPGTNTLLRFAVEPGDLDGLEDTWDGSRRARCFPDSAVYVW